MNYIGSKFSLLDFIFEGTEYLFDKNKDKRKVKDLIFCDAFAGTGAVGSFFKEQGAKIIANDVQFYSFVLNKYLIENNSLKINDNSLFEYLNKLEPKIKGFIYHNYCLGGTLNQEFERMYFSDENGIFCDTVRIEIESLFTQKEISQEQYYFLLASLLNSIDKYANTASVYGAFLKKIKKTASKTVAIKPVRIISSEQNHQVYNMDINKLIKTIAGDILYPDPPYNNRQYCDNYHILETIARDDNPKIKGKTGLRVDSIKYKSDFCYKNKAQTVLDSLIKNAKFKYILLSYNDEGIIPIDVIQAIMSKYGDYSRLDIQHQRFKASAKKTHKSKTIEYLHCLIKS